MNQASVAIESVSALLAGKPVELFRKGLFLVPLLPPANAPTDRAHVMLAETAPAHVTVQEVSEDGQVPCLQLVNTLARSVLAIEGELLEGCKQNRILTVNVLLEGHQSVQAPVSCVQRGRWSSKSEHMRRSGKMAPHRVRRTSKRSSSQSMRAGRGLTADQSGVWDSVDEVSRSWRAPSQSSDLSEMMDSRRLLTADIELRLQHALTGAVGYALAVAGRWRAVEVFGHASDFAVMSSSVVAGLATELVGLPRSERPVGLAPSHTPAAVVTAVFGSSATTAPSVGAGTEIRATRDDLAVSALVHEGKLQVLSLLAG